MVWLLEPARLHALTIILIDHRVLESMKAGKRLAESRFAVLNVAPKGQQSVSGMFARR